MQFKNPREMVECGEIFRLYKDGLTETETTDLMTKLKKDNRVCKKIPDQAFGYKRYCIYVKKLRSEL